MKLQTVAMDLLLMTKICVPRHTGFCLFVCLFECCCSVSHVFQCNKGTNTLIAEALLNIEQEKLDYITQKNAGDSHEFHNEDVKFFFPVSSASRCQNSPEEELAFPLRGSRGGATAYLRNTSKLLDANEHALSPIYTVWECKTSAFIWNGNGSSRSIWNRGHKLQWPVTFAGT